MAVSDLIVTPCRVLYSAVGLTLPADTLAAGGAWPSGWTEVAYTDSELSVKHVREKVEADIQESLTPITRAIGKETYEIETSLAEFLPANMVLATGGAYSATPASSGVAGKDEIVGGDDATIDERQWGFEGSYVTAAGYTEPIRLIIWKGVSDVGVELKFGKKTATGIPFKVSANPDMGKARGQRLFKLTKITAPAT